MGRDTTHVFGPGLRSARTIREDGTLDCDECGMPLFPFLVTEDGVRLECANHHHAEAPLPADKAVRGLVENWVAKRGAQLHVQHERWGTDELRPRDEETI